MQNSETAQDHQARQLAHYITSICLEPIPLAEEFFYASLPLCVIDAVFSIGVTYTSTRNTVLRFCKDQGWERTVENNTSSRSGQHSIGEFLHLFDGLSPEQSADLLFGNRQRTSTRSGILKAEAVRQFASSLYRTGINDFVDLTEDKLEIAETIIREIPGQKSGISFDYFRMLAGDDNLIKPDRMVQRFIGKAIDLQPGKVTPRLARKVLQKAIPLLAPTGPGSFWSARQLDYTIWATKSGN